MNKYRILFMGTSPFAVPTLRRLSETSHELLIVYTSPPKKANRGMKMSMSPVGVCAKEFNIDVHTPSTLKSLEEINKIKKLNLDLIIVVSYGFILPKQILTLPKYGCYNLHASLLPKWRGAAPIQRSMIEGDQSTGVTVMKMDIGLDTGDIASQKEVMIKDKNYVELETELAEEGSKLIVQFLNESIKNPELYSQNNDKATYATKVTKEETKINWNEESEKIVRRINAYSPKPGAWFMLNGKRVKITKAQVGKYSDQAGKIIDDQFNISCGHQSIRPLEIQIEGKKSSSIEEFLRGNKIKVGTILE